MKTTYRTFLPSFRRRQSGLALIVALIALVVMTLAGLALMRSVDTNTLIASNLAFRQSTRESTDAGIEAARDWLLDKAKDTPTTLESNSEGDGYYATRTGIDLTGSAGGSTVKWLDNNRTEASGATVSPFCLAQPDAAGNVVCYVIQRMCKETGAFDINICDSAITDGASGSGDIGSLNSLDNAPNPEFSSSQANSAVYRVTVRAAGPRNNFSYIQAFIAV